MAYWCVANVTADISGRLWPTGQVYRSIQQVSRAIATLAAMETSGR
jgi:hypothetical protein